MKDDKLIIKPALSESLLDLTREIFREYQKAIGIDLCFQSFETELANLPGKYSPPKGRLYLAFIGEQIAGCIALKPLEGSKCELKRLYVKPRFRGKQLGKILVEKIIADAVEIGYSEIYLDTLTTMESAGKLYLSLGFTSTEPYCFNPFDNVRYFKLDLTGRDAVV